MLLRMIVEESKTSPEQGGVIKRPDSLSLKEIYKQSTPPKSGDVLFKAGDLNARTGE